MIIIPTSTTFLTLHLQSLHYLTQNTLVSHNLTFHSHFYKPQIETIDPQCYLPSNLIIPSISKMLTTPKNSYVHFFAIPIFLLFHPHLAENTAHLR